jgi:CRISPR-associated protein Cmr4
MPSENVGGLLYLHALTPLHPGSGTALGVVDLPVQRERHTDWPVIPGSSVKGVLREACAEEKRRILFGRGGDEGGFYAGALTITDARLLAFPVRSLKGVFAWVTCPQALERWRRDALLAGQKVSLPALAVSEDEALAVEKCPCLYANGGQQEVILEEYKFTVKTLGELKGWPAVQGFDPKRVVVLNDTDFTHFAKHATEVSARIKLDPGTKTVSGGALFYQEFLPAETLMYSVVLAAGSRDGQNVSAEDVLSGYEAPGYIQVGGDETTGKGLCAVKLERGA